MSLSLAVAAQQQTAIRCRIVPVRERWAVLIACALLNAALYAAEPAEHSIERQRRSVERQLAAVERQTRAAARMTAPQVSREAVPSQCQQIEPEKIADIADRAAARHDVPKTLVRAVIRQESGGNPCAVSPKGALGLMQIMPQVAEELELASPFEPEQNVDAGVRKLKELLRRFGGDLPLVLAGYNAGPGAVERAGGVPDIEETKRYVASVLAALTLP